MDLARRLKMFFQDAKTIKKLNDDLSMVNLLGKLTNEDADKLAMLCLIIDNLDIPEIDLMFEDVNAIESPNMGEA